MPKAPKTVQYAARQEAWEEWSKRAEIGHYNAAHRMQLLAAFNAGWVARKAAQYSAIGAQRELTARKLVERCPVAMPFDLTPNKD